MREKLNWSFSYIIIIYNNNNIFIIIIKHVINYNIV